MKSVEEIKKQIEFALETKRIDGFIENDCLCINCPKWLSPTTYIVLTAPFFAIGVLVFFTYIGVKLRYVYWLPICYFLFTLAISALSKDFLTFDYNNNQFYMVSKFDKAIIWKGYFLNVKNILEIGINNSYYPKKKNNILRNENEEDILDNDFSLSLVYLNREGKIKSLSGSVFDKKSPKSIATIENLTNYCKLLGELLEIPSKICKKNEKLEVKNVDILTKTLNIIPIDISKEKKEAFKLRIKLALLQMFITVFIPLEIIFIIEYGFWGSFYAWYKMFQHIIFVIIPKELGLR